MEKQRKLNEEVINCIIVSMLDLLPKKEFDKISIIEIIEHAGVSRNSFYRNFANKEDILMKHIEIITDDFIREAGIPVMEVPWTSYISTLLNHMLRNRNLVDLLLRNNKLHLISGIFDKAIYQRSFGKIDENHIWFLSGGLFNLYQHWAKSNYIESPEDIAKTFDKVILGI